MIDPVQIGDSVMVVIDHPHNATVTDLFENGFTCVSASWPSVRREYVNEGMTWVRGHHADDSDTVKALLVARALRGYPVWHEYERT